MGWLVILNARLYNQGPDFRVKYGPTSVLGRSSNSQNSPNPTPSKVHLGITAKTELPVVSGRKVEFPYGEPNEVRNVKKIGNGFREFFSRYFGTGARNGTERTSGEMGVSGNPAWPK